MGGTSYLDLLTPLSLSVYWCILNIMFIAPKTPPWNHLLPFPSVDSDTLHYYNMAPISLFTTWKKLISVLTNKSLSHFTSWCSLGRKLIHYGLENIRNASIIRLKHQKFVPELTLKVPRSLVYLGEWKWMICETHTALLLWGRIISGKECIDAEWGSFMFGQLSLIEWKWGHIALALTVFIEH